MFCALPFPWHGWDEKARDKMLLCLPLIGLEIGLIWYAAAWLADFLLLPQALRAMVIAAMPFLLTGNMHLDGFMDVTDAVRSYRSLERRREILKDSHVGSFSVIALALVLLTQFASAVSIFFDADLRALILIPVISRCCSVIAIRMLPPMSTSQYANVKRSLPILPIIMLFGSISYAGYHRPNWGYPLIITAIAFGYALRKAYKSLQGMNGDISGYCITLSELAGLIAVTLLK